MARPLSVTEQRRAGLLVVAKRRATGLLLVVAAVFVASTVLLSRAHWLSWVQAAAIASLVGGLADWFAVTALFRRPLGLPIPHTAIVVERKDRFAETLGSFVQENFLSADAVSERLRSARAVQRLAGWLAEPDHAEDLAARIARKAWWPQPTCYATRTCTACSTRWSASSSTRWPWPRWPAAPSPSSPGRAGTTPSSRSGLGRLSRYLRRARDRAARATGRRTRPGGCPGPSRTVWSSASCTGPSRYWTPWRRNPIIPCASSWRPVCRSLPRISRPLRSTAGAARSSRRSCSPSPRSARSPPPCGATPRTSCAPSPPSPARSCGPAWPA